MTGSLAAKFSSTNANKNIVIPGQKVSFSFTSPPKDATEVQVTVRQSVSFLTSKADIDNEPIGGFRGSIKNGKFEVERVLGAPPPQEPDPVLIEIGSSFSPGGSRLFAHMPDPEL